MAILFGIVVGVGGLWGWRGYQGNQLQRAQQVYTQYVQIQQTIADKAFSQAQNLLSEMQAEDKNSPYVVFSALALAQLALETEQVDDAILHLTWVGENARIAYIKELALGRLARVLLEYTGASEAIDVLAFNATSDYAPALLEIQGDAWLALGHFENAIEHYQNALLYYTLSAQGGSGVSPSPLLQLKLEEAQAQAPVGVVS